MGKPDSVFDSLGSPLFHNAFYNIKARHGIISGTELSSNWVAIKDKNIVKF